MTSRRLVQTLARPLPFLAAAALLAACQSTPQPIETRFDARQAEAMLAPGDNTIEGTAFRRRDSGSVVTAAGEVVYLVPATAYAEERFRKLFPQGKLNPIGNLSRVEEAAPDYERLMRQTKADMRGRFTFERVRPGRYFVSTRLAWREPGGRPNGGLIYDAVEVRGSGATVEVILSGN